MFANSYIRLIELKIFFSLSMILCLDAKVSMHDQTWPTNQSYPNCKFEKKTIAVQHLYARVHTFLYL